MLKKIIDFFLPKSNTSKTYITGDKGFSFRGKEVQTDQSTITDAFIKVMAGVVVSPDIKNKLMRDYILAHKSGSPREEENVVIKHLLGTGWQWLEFDKWHQIFKKSGTWPYMWRRSPEIFEANNPEPFGLHEALYLFSVKDLKDWLKSNNLAPKPMPRKRSELEEYFFKNIKWHDLKPEVIYRHNMQRSFLNEKKEESKCRLLAHTITMTKYSTGNDYQREGTRFTDVQADVIGDCEVEAKFAEKFNQGRIKGLPPFFPGDRTILIINF